MRVLKKVLISIISLLLIVLQFPFTAVKAEYEYDTQSATVYITVTDITDVDNPLNILVEREELTVTNFDIAQFGEQYEGIEILDSGVTYLHALMALHEQHFGAGGVADNFKMDEDNITRIFWGKSVASIMYKNGNYIFAYPNYVTLKDGDEINICLYNEGYSQAVASFDKAYVYASPGEEINLSLFEHYEYPRQRNPIESAEIIDESLLYILDENHNIIKADENGNFNLKFDELGEHKVTIMPTYGYYLSNSGGTTIVWWESELVEKEVEHLITVENVTENLYPGDEKFTEIVSKFGNGIYAPAVVFEWGDSENPTPTATVDLTPGGMTYNYDRTEITVTTEWVEELVRKEQWISGEPTLMVNHTTPWVIINVSDELLFTSTKVENNKVSTRLKNSENYSGEIMCAAYTYEGDVLRLKHMQKQPIKDYVSFSFDKNQNYDVFKLFAWDSLGNMTPLVEAHTIDTTAEIQGADWNYSMPRPQNIIITGE